MVIQLKGTDFSANNVGTVFTRRYYKSAYGAKVNFGTELINGDILSYKVVIDDAETKAGETMQLQFFASSNEVATNAWQSGTPITITIQNGASVSGQHITNSLTTEYPYSGLSVYNTSGVYGVKWHIEFDVIRNT